MSFWEMFPPDMNSPASTKKGMHIRGKESIPVNIFCTIRVNGMSAPRERMAATEDSTMAYATGMPTMTRIARDKNKTRTINHASFPSLWVRMI